MAQTARMTVKVTINRTSSQYPQPSSDFELQDTNGNPTALEFDIEGTFIQRRLTVPVASGSTFGSRSISLTSMTGRLRRNCILVNSGPATLYVQSFVHHSKTGNSAASILQAWTYAPATDGTAEAGICLPPGAVFILPFGYAATVKNANQTDVGLLDLFLAEVDDDLATDVDDNA